MSTVESALQGLKSKIKSVIDQLEFPVVLAVQTEQVASGNSTLSDLLLDNQETSSGSDIDAENDQDDYETVLQLVASGLAEQEDLESLGSFLDCIDLEIQDGETTCLDQYSVTFSRSDDGTISFDDDHLLDLINQWTMEDGGLEAFLVPS